MKLKCSNLIWSN